MARRPLTPYHSGVTLPHKCAKTYGALAAMNAMVYPGRFLLQHRPLPVHGLGQSVAFTGKDYDVAVVNEPVDQGGSQTVVAKDRVPL